MKTLGPRLEGSPEYAVLGTGADTSVHRPGCPHDSPYRLTAVYRASSPCTKGDARELHPLSDTLHRSWSPAGSAGRRDTWSWDASALAQHVERVEDRFECR